MPRHSAGKGGWEVCQTDTTLDEVTVVLRQYIDGNIDAENHSGKPSKKEAPCTH
jgi:hypothetical protein